MQTWKAHFISGLSGTHRAFPQHLWYRLIEQANITLNLLRSLNINMTHLAYSQLFGKLDFNATPISLPGYKCLFFEPPSSRSPWCEHAQHAFYIGPALTHFRSYKMYIVKTISERIEDTIHVMPHNVKTPKVTSANKIRISTRNLQIAMNNAKVTHMNNEKNEETKAVEKLKEILNKLNNKYRGKPTRVKKQSNTESKNNYTASPRVKPSKQLTQMPRINNISLPKQDKTLNKNTHVFLFKQAEINTKI